jgi:outer membrane receptor for ferrienterochelin and colicin
VIKKYLVLLLVILLAATSQAQKFTINGYVTDKTSGERLSGASVFIYEKNTGTTSNAYGFYSITLPAQTDSLEVQFSFAGYDIYKVKLLLNDNIKLDIRLDHQKQLENVTVRASRRNSIQNTTQMSSIGLSSETIKALPAFLGEADVLKAIQLLPGVQAGSEGSSGIYVRGGGPDQNLILLDGVPVYNASHLFGFFSVFNADAINGVDVIKGGFPARYGGRLSSVIDIRMKEGNNNEFHGEGGIGIIATRFTLEGPIKKNRSSFMISARRTYADIFLRPIIKAQSDGNSTGGYYFYDLNAKANLYITEKDHLYVSGYFGNDKFSAKDKYDDAGGKSVYEAALKWGNATAMMRWNHEFNRKLFGNLTVNYSRYQFDISDKEEDYDPVNGTETFLEKYFSGIRDWSAKMDFDWLPSPNHFVKWGLAQTWHSYRPGALQSKANTPTYNEDTVLSGKFINTTELDSYIEDDIRLSKNLKVNAGVHFTVFNVEDKSYFSLQPRLAARYLLTKDMSIKASYAQMNQFIHLLTNSGIGLPTDLWVPATKIVPPQQSHQYAVGWAYNIKDNYEVSVEGYYKKMNNIIEYAEGASFVSTTGDWQTRVVSGEGKSYGAEFFLQKKKGRTTGMIGYTLSWTNRHFDELNNGNWFPYKYDRRHDIKLAVVHNISSRIQLSADWVYGTGVAITLPVAVYSDSNGQEVEIYNSRNDFRMPAYHRMDVGIKFIKKRKKWERSWNINIYNVYNRLNTFFIYRGSNYDFNTGVETPVFYKVTLFPIIPSLSYQFKF